MPTLTDLVVLLAGIPINGRDQRKAYIVAGHLLKEVLQERWHKLSETKKEQLRQYSKKHLWNGYMSRRQQGQSPREAAEEAIRDELARLAEVLKQK